MHEIRSDLPGTISWFKRVPPGWVEAYRIVGWVVEPVAPSHHDAHCVLMRYGGQVAADAKPPVPKSKPRLVRKSYAAPTRTWGGAPRR